MFFLIIQGKNIVIEAYLACLDLKLPLKKLRKVWMDDFLIFFLLFLGFLLLSLGFSLFVLQLFVLSLFIDLCWMVLLGKFCNFRITYRLLCCMLPKMCKKVSSNVDHGLNWDKLWPTSEYHQFFALSILFDGNFCINKFLLAAKVGTWLLSLEFLGKIDPTRVVGEGFSVSWKFGLETNFWCLPRRARTTLGI